LKIFEEAKLRGHEIELHFVWIPDVREAIRRVRQRVIEGGHHVPAEDIRRRFARSIKHFLNDYASLADRWAVWDNSAPPAKLLANSATQSTVDLRKFFAAS
jgi:predicted ABC-type ATPase